MSEQGKIAEQPPEVAQDPLKTYEDFTNMIKSTGKVIGGNSVKLDKKVQSIEKSLDTLSKSVQDQKSGKNPESVEGFTEKIQPLVLDIKAIRDEILPQLQVAESLYAKVEGFMRKNMEFFISAVEAEGNVKSITNQLDALEKRLSKVESHISRSKDRITTIASVIIALLSLGVAFSSCAILAYNVLTR